MARRLAQPCLTDAQRDSLIAFLRDWLPDEAKAVYRELIRENPEAWWRDDHFAGGIILNFALRGNGFDERALGVADLAPLWPDLLERAVSNDGDEQELDES